MTLLFQMFLCSYFFLAYILKIIVAHKCDGPIRADSTAQCVRICVPGAHTDRGTAHTHAQNSNLRRAQTLVHAHRFRSDK